VTFSRTPFSANDRKFVKQKTGAGGYLLLCPNTRHCPFKAR